MSTFSIRLRLTMWIVLITGAISAIGVLFGLRLLEGQVRDAAIDDRAEQFAVFGDVVPGGSIVANAEAAITEIAVGGFAVVDDFALAVSADEAEQIREFVVESLGQLPDFSEAAQSIGNDEGELFVWLGGEEVLLVSEDSSRWVTFEDVGQAPLLSWTDVLEVGQQNPFDSFDQVVNPSSADDELQLEFGRRDIDGTQVAFIAEVSDELAALEAIRSTLQMVVLALTLVAGILTWVIAGRALRPVKMITEQVRDISVGTLDERVVEPSSNDEVGLLARTMNTMLSRLETSDLKRRQFVSDASHELRTPVAVLRSEAEVARRAPDSTTIDAFAQVVLGESKRLEGLVEDLLSLARSDEASVLTATIPIDIDEIVLIEADRTRSVPVDKSEVSAGRVLGHADDLARVMAHLLDNAARHASSQVAVGLQTADGVVSVWVDDDGPGVTEESRQRIFERFIRLDDARTRDVGGAGLGLAVVQSTVERMNGHIEVGDSRLGGARFRIDFPAA